MPGPARNASKPTSRAHRAGGSRSRAALVVLPAAGCDLEVPDLPEGRPWSAEENRLWDSLWTSPQATEWDDSYIAAVAAYVCHASAIYTSTAAAWQAQEFRHLGDKLGLTPAGMAALGWVIE